MKTIRLIICLLAGLFQIISFSTKADSFPLTVYIEEHGVYTQVDFILDVVTSEGAYHGEYYQDGKKLLTGTVPNRVWTGLVIFRHRHWKLLVNPIMPMTAIVQT